MELQGKVIAALPERSGVSQRGTEWKVQEFVIETQEQYPKKMVFEVFGSDRLSRFNIQIGQTVLVAFDIDAREWNGRWFNSIRAYDVRQIQEGQGGPIPVSSDSLGDAAAPVAVPAPAAPIAAPDASESSAEAGTDELPF